MFKNTLLASAMALSVYTLSTNAQAGHRPQEWYLGIEAGVTWEDKATAELPKLPDPSIKFDSDLAILGEIGYRWDSNWRLELELGYRNNDVDCVQSGKGPCSKVWGGISQFTQMVNVIHDFDLDEKTALSVGMGLGGSAVSADGAQLTDDSDYVFAAQAILQLSHELTEGVDLVLAYRFLATDNPEFAWKGVGRFETDNENHTLSVGLRFDLQSDESAPVAVPVVASAPPSDAPKADVAPRQFIVFFGFNKSNLTREARNIVHDAAMTAMHDGFVSILVSGHTDTSGSAKYNQRLSTQRADAVRKALVTEGIPAQGISSVGKGETELKVQTGDNVKEPQNRRTEISLD
jgi:outer membrane protein OmpA-like peptidoglycan-associated protein